MPLGVARRNQRDQRGSEYDALHLLKELALAGFLHTALEVQRGLFHGLDILGLGMQHPHQRASYAEFP